MRNPRLIVIGPLPPPVHGVAVSTSLVLSNRELHERFEVEHLDTSDHRSRDNIGKWEFGNVALGLRNTFQLATRLRGDGAAGIVYLPLSQGYAFLRDSLFIHTARLAGWKVAIHLRGSEFHDLYGRSSGPFRLLIRLTLRRVASAAVMGPSLRGAFGDLVPADRIAVVANGTPDPQLNGNARDPETVLFLSSLRRRKGVVEAVEAALRVYRQRPRARFIFVGSWENEELERQLRTRAAGSRGAIRFLEAVDGEEKRRLLATASVLLFPPIRPEGHPRVVIEGLAAGLPIVTTNTGSIADTVVHGESGFVLDDPNPDELAVHLVRLLQDDQLRERMARAARKRYLDSFTQTRADSALADWLQGIAEMP
jgi:glycosyltransferase involved in cell wall biosynthesis